jgi:hypothetical protein
MKRVAILTGMILLTGLQQVLSQSQRSINEPLPTRQVHLDFHTSGLIPGIGERFDKAQFQEALKLGNLNQINIFAKGHHGYSYYPTKLGTVHPNLEFDLLGAQIEACHEIGVKCPIYFTVGWSALDAEQHPEWVIRHRNGEPATINLDLNALPSDIRPHYSWECLDPSIGGGYHEYIMECVKEICERYGELDGFWFDIYHIIPASYTVYSLERMKTEGVDPDDPEAVERSYAMGLKAHMKALRELVARYHPDATVYFNSATHIEDKTIFRERLFEMNTQAEIEDLPTTWGGYDKFPLEAKYHLAQGTPVVAMSGKFHKAWGEFGGFKHPDAIKYEAAAMISFGASCNFGDQLHPSGEMDLETYRNIGKAYRYVEQIEDYGPGGIPVSKLGLWITLDHASDFGVVNMLLQLHHDFIVANEDNLDELEIIVIPGHASLTVSQAARINAWVKNGGKLIVFGEGAMNQEGRGFLLDVGCEFLGRSEYDFDFTVIQKDIEKEMVTTPFLNYESGMLVKPTGGEVLAIIREPYFNRTYAQYSSHRETPYKLENSSYPAVVRYGNVIFFTHHLDQLYFEHGVRLHRQLFSNAIDLLYEHPHLKVNNLPSCGRVSLLKQEYERRYVTHLLYAPALLRGEKVEVIEDFLPVPNVELEVCVPEEIKEVYQIPGETRLEFQRTGDLIRIKVPTFTMHTAVVLSYE